jgi:beta-lactamase regulating signal transducer with metallopeptidase domain
MMTAALNLSELARLCAGRLLNSMFEGIVIGLFTWILLLVAGRRNSSTRFAVWFSALLAIAALPVLGGPASSPALARAASVITIPNSWALALFFVWATSAGASLLRVSASLWQLRKLRASCSAIDAAALDPVLRATLQGFQVTRSVQLCQSDRVRVPTAIGFHKPLVVIPAWALQELSTTELNSILIHELAHLRRRDDWTNLAQQIVKALLFFHPAVWWIENKLALEREMACDDAVLAETANPRGYAQCLISLAEKSFMRRGLALAQAVVNRMHQTSLRVSQILDTNRPGATRVWKPALYSVAAFSAVCLVWLSHAPELVAFEDRMPEVTVASATPANEMLTSAADSNFGAKQAVATRLIFQPKSTAETLLRARRIGEGTSSLVPQAAQTKSGLQRRRREIAVQPSFSAAAKALPARRAGPRQDAARPTEAGFEQPSLDDLARAKKARFIEEDIAPQTIVVVFQSDQYRQAGPMLWRLCVWQVVVFDSSNAPVETRIHAKKI